MKREYKLHYDECACLLSGPASKNHFCFNSKRAILNCCCSRQSTVFTVNTGEPSILISVVCFVCFFFFFFFFFCFFFFCFFFLLLFFLCVRGGGGSVLFFFFVFLGFFFFVVVVVVVFTSYRLGRSLYVKLRLNVKHRRS